MRLDFESISSFYTESRFRLKKYTRKVRIQILTYFAMIPAPFAVHRSEVLLVNSIASVECVHDTST